MRVFRKRVTQIEIPITDQTSKDILDSVKVDTYSEKLISDTFFIEDDKGIILDKEKVIYDGVGHTFVYPGTVT